MPIVEAHVATTYVCDRCEKTFHYAAPGSVTIRSQEVIDTDGIVFTHAWDGTGVFWYCKECNLDGWRK